MSPSDHCPSSEDETGVPDIFPASISSRWAADAAFTKADVAAAIDFAASRIISSKFIDSSSPTYRARKILNSLDNTRKKEDKEDEYEYESSPAPSISGDMSFLDFDSDDSMKDPTFKPEVKDKQTTFFDLQKTEDEQLNEKSPKIVILSNIDVSNFNQISETQTKTTTKKKRTKCKFCQTDVTNFERHLERNHDDTKEVQDMMSFPKSHPERKKILSLLRNAANFTEYLKGNVQPKYHYKTESKEYYPCSRCKAMLSKSYLSRHKKNCILKHTNNNEIRKMNSLAASQTLIASSFDDNSNLHKLRVKEEVFDRMKPDYISLVAKSDYLIYNFGENYLKKHRREQLVTVCSNKMRELARWKGSRPIAILFPQTLQTYIDFFVKIRQEHHLVPENNPYLFGCPGTSKWTRGDVIIRKFAQEADLEFPKQISSNRLRKQIATVMQILNLSKEESEQFAHFMGHTEKTHNEFYKLPQDVYQTAKISKLLMLMEKGVDKYKGKSLNEININPMSEFAEEESDNEDNDFLDANESDCTAFQAIPEEESRPVSKKKISGRTFWTSEQALLVKKHFKSHISTKKAPKRMNACS
ncbi:unnamed protein product [Acanthoscelides obtectus]|uniref:Uncharacterized protein n=1 Tax=Acanthoscelides obtectus TaxID=200917 RepID=A0A9P0L1B9_ACAOB|nr:unnamed protein product [Acanthoscelides obtectus]CAK1650631.1 hypothetical protein AOBTE_LOCUS16837 [Acanthoscelides obtectus]